MCCNFEHPVCYKLWSNIILFSVYYYYYYYYYY